MGSTFREDHLHCCLVEQHSDIVPFLFSLMREKIVPMENVLFVHFDAHPDLMPISKPFNFEDTKDPHKLIEILEEPGGISEFILPLVYNKYFSEVYWIKSPWCDQINDGDHSLIIGEVDNRAVVSLESSYYFDEGIVYDPSLISNKIPFELKVYKIPSNQDFSSCVKHKSNWVLDICLDYFTTTNPFYEEISQLFKTEHIDSAKINVIQEFFKKLAYKTETYGKSTEDRRKEKTILESELVDLIRSLQHKHPKSVYFDHRKLANKLDNSLDENFKSQLVLDFIDVMKALSPSSRKRIIDISHLINLPYHVSDESEIDEMFCNFNTHLNKLIELLGLPVAVTIARSSLDEYTPIDKVSYLQDKTIQIISTIIQENQKCLKVHDLCDNAYEKCYYLFVDQRLKKHKLTH